MNRDGYFSTSAHLMQPNNPVRRRQKSTEEPNALRLSRTSAPVEALCFDTGNNDQTSTSLSSHAASPDASTAISPFAKAQPDNGTPQPYSDPASWLPSTDLLSPNFNAHHFLQRVLSRCNDKLSRPTRIPQLDDTFDADAALAALDTVESALRRRRDAARRDELCAREDLRNTLHISAKRRDLLLRSAHSVASQVASFGETGKRAAEALRTDLSTLKTESRRLADLQDARDLLALLSRDAAHLDAVRVSKLLANAKTLLESGQLSTVLSDVDITRARREIFRCERELAASIFDWMKRATDKYNPDMIAECAMAAEQLGMSHRFIEVYVQHIFSYEKSSHFPICQFDDSSPTIILESFRNACWESTSIVRESAGIIVGSFSDPCKPLATMLQMLAKKKVLVVSDAILSALVQSVRDMEQKLQNLKTTEIDSSLSFAIHTEHRRRSSLERMRSISISDSKENWRENVQRLSDVRRRYLTICADIFRSLSKLKSELFNFCRTAGVEDIENTFAAMDDPYCVFLNHHLSRYLEIQKAWMDDRLGSAFFDITRIDLHAPRLAPRERSNADVYHRYRAFYGHVSSTFQQMTIRALQSTQESIFRTAAVFGSIPITDANCVMAYSNNDLVTEPMLSPKDQKDTLKRQYSGHEDGERINLAHTNGSSSRNPRSLTEMRVVVRELLDSLVMNYLANVETLLQAATHLLPTCEDDAKTAQLWTNGASPLAAYIQAVEVLSKSNQLVDDFVNSLAVEESDIDQNLYVASEEDVLYFIPIETRELVHGELTSGLSDLSAEAQIGVQAVISSLSARLLAMLTTKQATGAYYDHSGDDDAHSGRNNSVTFDEISRVGLDTEPSEAFISASTFIEQQLQAVMSSMSGDNKQFVISEISRITREAVLNCWCNIKGPVTVSGALQMIADGKTMMRVFQEHNVRLEPMECLPAIGQLFLEPADGLWCYVESKTLGSVDAHVISALLQKRDDFTSERVKKVCQSLSADINLAQT